MFLTREDVVSMTTDNATKVIEIPEHIPSWGGKSVGIRQLTRGQQDEYLKRQFGGMRLKQDTRAKSQELTSTTVYGHDAWVCIQGMIDDTGVPLFTLKDEAMLTARNGEAVGWIAKQIVEWSGMQKDVEELKQIEDEIKNSPETQT